MWNYKNNKSKVCIHACLATNNWCMPLFHLFKSQKCLTMIHLFKNSNLTILLFNFLETFHFLFSSAKICFKTENCSLEILIVWYLEAWRRTKTIVELKDSRLQQKIGENVDCLLVFSCLPEFFNNCQQYVVLRNSSSKEVVFDVFLNNYLRWRICTTLLYKQKFATRTTGKWHNWRFCILLIYLKEAKSHKINTLDEYDKCSWSPDIICLIDNIFWLHKTQSMSSVNTRHLGKHKEKSLKNIYASRVPELIKWSLHN